MIEAGVRVLILLAAVLFLVSPAGAQEYRLGAQDKIVVTVFGQQDLSGEFELDGEGRVALPLIGEVGLRNLTLREAEAKVADRLHPEYLVNPNVSISVTNYRPFYILGEVKQPGGYPFVNGMTVMQAVALAGGFTYRARTNDLVIMREGSRWRASQETPVLPGDTIEVPERFF